MTRRAEPTLEPLAPAAPARPGVHRFTRDGSAALEAHLAGVCAAAWQGVQTLVPASKLEGVMLGGGYGRGEGGVLCTPAGHAPYNDLEFYVCIRGHPRINERRWGPALQALAGRLMVQAGIDVEFKVISLRHLRRSPITMFYYDLVMGHHWLGGEERLLQGCEHHEQAERIPLAEATRLLMNRCSGLLLAREHLVRHPFTEADADFVGRNLAKAQLAFGDAVICACGQYHWSCCTRGERLRALPLDGPWLADVRQHHVRGVEFKLHPRRVQAPAADLRPLHEELAALGLRVWLWLESRRLGRSFNSARGYALAPINKCPETSRWRNWLISVAQFGPGAGVQPGCCRYPRQRVLETLALLLWEPGTLSDPAVRRRVRHALHTPATGFAGLVAAYENLWRRFG